MTEAERIARAHRAKSALDEFLDPMFAEIEATYSERLIEVANNELARDTRSDKITALSNALKIVKILRSGMAEIVRDGELANRQKIKATEIEKMTTPQRRLLGLAPQRY